MRIFKLFVVFFCWIVALSTFAETFTTQIEPDGYSWKQVERFGLFGASDLRGKVIIPAKYHKVQYENNTFTVKNLKGLLGKYDKNGSCLIEADRYAGINELSIPNSPFIVIKDMYGVINHKGQRVLDDVYSYIVPIIEKKTGKVFYVFKKDGWMGVADEFGNNVIPSGKYHSIGNMYDGNGDMVFTYTIYGGGSGVCDRSGNTKIHTPYFVTQPVLQSKDEVYTVFSGKGSAKVDKNGRLITNFINEGNTIVQNVKVNNKNFTIKLNKNEEFVIYDSQNRIVPTKQYDWIGPSNNGESFIAMKGLYIGLLREDGSEIISPSQKFIDITAFNDHYNATTPKNKKAWINRDGKVIFPAKYKQVDIFKVRAFTANDTLVAYCDDSNKWGLQTIDGRVIIKPEWDYVDINQQSYVTPINVYKDGKIGIADLSGNIIIKPEYSKIEISGDSSNKCYYLYNEYVGIADLSGKMIIAPERFRKIEYNSTKKEYTCIEKGRICIFDRFGNLKRDNKNQYEASEYIFLADDAFESKDYKKAAKLYGKAIKLDPCAALYFNRGISYFNVEKYGDAADDFKTALNSDPSDNVRQRAIELYDEAIELQHQKEVRRAEIARAVFGLALGFADVALQTYTRTKYANTNFDSASSGSTYSSGSSSYSSSSSSTSSSSSSSYSPKAKQKCGICHGTGTLPKDAITFGNPKKEYCSQCGTEKFQHYHASCPKCHGHGEY